MWTPCDLALDALEQAVREPEEARAQRLVRQGDRGVLSLGIRYAERLAEAGSEPSVGSKGESYDNALSESAIGLFKTDVIRCRRQWRGLEDGEFATLERVWWLGHHHLLEPIHSAPPVEYEEAFYRCQEISVTMAALRP